MATQLDRIKSSALKIIPSYISDIPQNVSTLLDEQTSKYFGDKYGKYFKYFGVSIILLAGRYIVLKLYHRIRKYPPGMRITFVCINIHNIYMYKIRIT